MLIYASDLPPPPGEVPKAEGAALADTALCRM